MLDFIIEKLTPLVVISRIIARGFLWKKILRLFVYNIKKEVTIRGIIVSAFPT